ncbi:unnamed protein product, partial [Mesorhabditis belari]|uniref:Uncharacterized protein n=1 Tax=Mesorhabditis belari TaxID=2138241 RepID=A0AAF3F8J3_9BILA
MVKPSASRGVILDLHRFSTRHHSTTQTASAYAVGGWCSGDAIASVERMDPSRATPIWEKVLSHHKPYAMTQIEMPVWVWRPNRRVDEEPDPDDEEYRGCCGVCKSEICFQVILGVSIFGLLSLARSIPQTQFVGLLGFLIGLSVFIVGVMAVKTRKPFYIQIYWIAQIIGHILTVIALVYTTIGLAVVYSQIDVRYMDLKKQALMMLIAYALATILLIPIAFWILFSIYTYYTYLRDCQLWIEQQDGPFTVDVQ